MEADMTQRDDVEVMECEMECGHPARDVTTYAPHGPVRNWKYLWRVCDQCRVAYLWYAGSSVFSYDQTGPGADLSDYHLDCEEEGMHATTISEVLGAGECT